MKYIVLFVTLLTGSCASAPLPPHVYIEIPHVQAADLFWWTDTQQCEIRVMYQDPTMTPTDLAGFTVPIDKSVCLAWLNSEGYDIKKVAKP